MAWHRLLADGELTYDGGAYPLNYTVLAGEVLYTESDYIMSLKAPEQVRDIAVALSSIDEPEFRRRYFSIPASGYDAASLNTEIQGYSGAPDTSQHRNEWMSLEIHLCALDPAMAQAWSKHFGLQPGVTIHQGDILKRKADAILSPANSFGFMDGGIDLAYSHFFGWDLQDRLQERLRREYSGRFPDNVTWGPVRVPTSATKLRGARSSPSNNDRTHGPRRGPR